MNLQHIESFLKIVEFGSITKAAENLYISQSTLSDRLKALENELGYTLIIRGSGVKTTKLTDRGTEFLDFAHRYLRLVDQLDQWKNSDTIETLSIGTPQSLLAYFFEDFFKEMLEVENLHLDLSAHSNRTIYNMVNSSELNVGIVARPYQSPNIKTIPIFQEKLHVIYDSRYADYESTSDLPADQEIYIEWGPSYEYWYQKHWNIQDSPKISLDSPRLMMSYLQSKGSWAIAPQCIYTELTGKNDHIVTLPVDEDIYRRLYLIHPQSFNNRQHPTLNTFINHLFDFIQKAEAKGLCESLV